MIQFEVSTSVFMLTSERCGSIASLMLISAGYSVTTESSDLELSLVVLNDVRFNFPRETWERGTFRIAMLMPITSASPSQPGGCEGEAPTMDLTGVSLP